METEFFWANRVGVCVDVAADKQKEENEDTRKGGRAEKCSVDFSEKKSSRSAATVSGWINEKRKPDGWILGIIALHFRPITR